MKWVIVHTACHIEALQARTEIRCITRTYSSCISGGTSCVLVLTFGQDSTAGQQAQFISGSPLQWFWFNTTASGALLKWQGTQSNDYDDLKYHWLLQVARRCCIWTVHHMASLPKGTQLSLASPLCQKSNRHQMSWLPAKALSKDLSSFPELQPSEQFIYLTQLGSAPSVLCVLKTVAHTSWCES